MIKNIDDSQLDKMLSEFYSLAPKKIFNPEKTKFDPEIEKHNEKYRQMENDLTASGTNTINDGRSKKMIWITRVIAATIALIMGTGIFGSLTNNDNIEKNPEVTTQLPVVDVTTSENSEDDENIITSSEPIVTTTDSTTEETVTTTYDYSDIKNTKDFTYITANNEVIIVKYTGEGENVVVPSEIDGMPVTALDECAISCMGADRVDHDDYYYSEDFSIKIEKFRKIKNIVLPDTLKTIGKHAIHSCKNLTSINIPNGVTSIGDSAFDHCSSLTSINIPNSVTHIGNGAFANCIALTSITIPSSITEIQPETFYLCENLASVTIPDSVTSIGDSAFFVCESLTNVSLPNSVITIGDSAFYNCSNFTDIVIPDSIQHIGSDAFYGCSNLTDIVIPDSIQYIGCDAFYGCPENTLEKIENKYPLYPLYQFDYSIENNSVTIRGYKGTSTELVIPSEIEGMPVVSIGANAFESSTIISVEIPDSVTSIGDYAFNLCSNLTTVKLPEGLTHIGEQAFSLCCTHLKNIEIPSTVRYIGSGAFASCYAINELVIPEGITCIKERTFFCTTTIEKLTVPDSVTTIENNAFNSNWNLTIYCHKGSAIDTYAKEHNIPVSYID